jgi:hypothetical protein
MLTPKAFIVADGYGIVLVDEASSHYAIPSPLRTVRVVGEFVVLDGDGHDEVSLVDGTKYTNNQSMSIVIFFFTSQREGEQQHQRNYQESAEQQPNALHL